MCLSRELEPVVKLASTPPGNHFLSKDRLDTVETRYPLELVFCHTCHHLQLGHVVNPVILYQKDYSYVSSTSDKFVQHLESYAKQMVDKYQLTKNCLVVDIGSNDGTCLKWFKESGMQVQGVDPADNIAQIARDSGVPTRSEFFCPDTARKIVDECGKASLITSHNVCAHIDDLESVVEGVKILLDEKGVFIFEVGYFLDVFNQTWFDTIYHEHLDYHTVEPMNHLFKRHGMQVVSVERISPQGGSIRIHVQKHTDDIDVDRSVNELIALEKENGFRLASTFHSFESKINRVKMRLRELIDGIKRRGSCIAGFGAPTKATTLMSHFEIDNKDINFIVDDNPLKQGLYTPASHIPVFSADAIYQEKPEYLLILAWNFADPIMHRHQQYARNIGRFILPMPEPVIVY